MSGKKEHDEELCDICRLQALRCNSSTEFCRRDPECHASPRADPSGCVSCAVKDDLNQNPVSKTLLASSIFQQPQPLAPRLLAKSGGKRLLADNRAGPPTTARAPSENKTSAEKSYDDYYEYDESDSLDKNDFGEEDDYLDDYVEPIDKVIQESDPIRKPGVCPKVVPASCDRENIVQSDCRFDTDCAGEQKCCEAPCDKRVCSIPITSKSTCPVLTFDRDKSDLRRKVRGNSLPLTRTSTSSRRQIRFRHDESINI